jgi:hypothetical protein
MTPAPRPTNCVEYKPQSCVIATCMNERHVESIEQTTGNRVVLVSGESA